MSIRSAASRWFLPVLILIAVAGGSLAVAMRGPSDEQRAYKLACEAVRAKLPAELREEARFPGMREARIFDASDMLFAGYGIQSRVDVGIHSVAWSASIRHGEARVMIWD